MASTSYGQRIERELSKRATCSFLDLKSSLRLSRGDIEAYTERLANRGLVRIKKDDREGNHFYIKPRHPKKGLTPRKTAVIASLVAGLSDGEAAKSAGVVR